jgi:pimeloyl-ACP methyl ester carboxylesterase
LKTEKTHIYFVPGLAASTSIFEYLQLPNHLYEIHLLEWLLPNSKTESLKDYSKRLVKKITHTKFILVGVSFGGIVVQEMCSFCRPLKTIIISSVKHENEFPKRFKIIRKSKAYKLAPVKSINNIENFAKFIFGDAVKKRVALYQKYMAMRDKTYLSWAIYNVLHWKQTNVNNKVIHIHGSGDQVFPIKNIENCIKIDGGTHVMILNKAKKISKILEEVC